MYWLFVEFRSVQQVLQDRFALGFILDVALALVGLSVYFARHPLGRVKWP